MELNRQSLHIHNRIHRIFQSQPVTMGIPWPQGVYTDTSGFAAFDEEGGNMPCSFTVLNRWKDGSIQWALFDMPVDFQPSGNRTITFAPSSGKTPVPQAPVAVTNRDGEITAGNGLVEMVFSGKKGLLVRSWRNGGEEFVGRTELMSPFRTGKGTFFHLSRRKKRSALNISTTAGRSSGLTAGTAVKKQAWNCWMRLCGLRFLQEDRM